VTVTVGCRSSLLGAGVASADLRTNLTSERRTWIETCYEDWNKFHAKWAPVDQRTREALKKLAALPYYEAIPKLTALYEGLSVEAQKLKISEEVESDGVGFEVARVIYAKQREIGDPTDRWGGIVGFWDGAAPVSGDEFYDRNHFCARRFSSLNGGRIGPGAADYWLSEGAFQRFRELDQKVRIEPYKAALAVADRPDDWQSGSGRVDAISRSGNTVVLSVTIYDEALECHRTGRIDRIEADGSVHYESDCHVNEHPRVVGHEKVSFPAFPSLGVQRGDYVDYEGRGAREGTPNRVLSSGHLASVYRGKQAIGSWRGSYNTAYKRFD
jgi:hypothetical protein